MQAVEVKNVSKSYGGRTVVDSISFTVDTNEILGLIGPNGAGKTTNIRMIMDVIKPDSGEVLLFGEKFNNELKSQIGYLPEERGLYRHKTIIDSMVYLANLKGLDSTLALKRADEWLHRVNLHTQKNKKIAELSHGMAQLIQLLVTILHDPKFIILDEPFNGLDPVNVKLVKDIILELKMQHKAIILSTHRMNEVEELSDRIFMINKGKKVLFGPLSEIKRSYRSNSLIVEYNGKIPELAGMRYNSLGQNKIEIHFDPQIEPQTILEQLVQQKVEINRFEISTPTLNDIFIRLAGG
jgi:ABC-2 type transport system ATP-binding protein